MSRCIEIERAQIINERLTNSNGLEIIQLEDTLLRLVALLFRLIIDGLRHTKIGFNQASRIHKRNQSKK